MKNQKVITSLGTIVLVIFSITVSVLVWQVIKNRESAEKPQEVINVKKPAVTQTPQVPTENKPNQAQNGFTEADKNKLVQAFIVYVKTLDSSKHPEKSTYLNKNLYVRINKNTENYLSGTMFIVGSKNISAPYFLAFKQDNNWKVVFNGQDIPNCSLIEPFNFPSEIVAKCYDEVAKKEKEIL